MAVSGVAGIILSGLSTLHRFGVYSGTFPGVLSHVRHYAARKGTREKAKKKKVKVEVKKLTFAEKVNRSKKEKIIPPDALLYKETSFPEVEDDVYFQKLCAWKKYPFSEAIQCHREWLHPTMYNSPSSIVNIFVELNFKGIKPTKPVETFRRIISMKHSFDHGEDRKILVFAKSEEDVKDALDSGAALAGGADIVKLIVSGEVSLHNYDTVLAHPSAMPEILTIRGLLKRKHPNLRAGTMGSDIRNMVYTHLHGIKYVAEPFDHYPEYGRTTIPIGKLDMDIEHLEDNMKDAIASIMMSKPKRPGSFITRIRILCPPSLEKFKINEKLYVEDDEDDQIKKDKDEDDDDEDEDAAVAVSL